MDAMAELYITAPKKGTAFSKTNRGKSRKKTRNVAVSPDAPVIKNVTPIKIR
jgi:hypothetical protein